MTEASSSVAMEAVGFRRGLNYLLERGVEVEVATTDRSPSIRKIMREDYKEIHHEFDIWHVVKGIKWVWAFSHSCSYLCLVRVI